MFFISSNVVKAHSLQKQNDLFSYKIERILHGRLKSTWTEVLLVKTRCLKYIYNDMVEYQRNAA